MQTEITELLQNYLIDDIINYCIIPYFTFKFDKVIKELEQLRQEAKEKFCGKNECGMLYDKRANFVPLKSIKFHRTPT